MEIEELHSAIFGWADDNGMVLVSSEMNDLINRLKAEMLKPENVERVAKEINARAASLPYDIRNHTPMVFYRAMAEAAIKTMWSE